MNTMAMNLMAQPRVNEVAVAKQPELKSADERQFLDFDVSKCQILTLSSLKELNVRTMLTANLSKVSIITN